MFEISNQQRLRRKRKQYTKPAMTVPQALLSPLHKADGSATYSQAGYTVIGAVNGPIEVQRRDELPSEAAIEVNIRPSIGIGSTSALSLPTPIQPLNRF